MTRACSQRKGKLSALNELGKAEQRLGHFKLKLISLYNPCRGRANVQKKLVVSYHMVYALRYGLLACVGFFSPLLLQCSLLDIILEKVFCLFQIPVYAILSIGLLYFVEPCC